MTCSGGEEADFLRLERLTVFDGIAGGNLLH
jgi:hypothetical protein